MVSPSSFASTRLQETDVRDLLLIPFLALALIFLPVAPSSALQDPNGANRPENTLHGDAVPELEAIEEVARLGYFDDAESYNDELRAFEALGRKVLDADSLGPAEVAALKERIERLKQGIPLWIDRLVADARSLEDDGLVTFKGASWTVLAQECKDLSFNRRVGEPSPLEWMADGLDSIGSGADFDWQGAAERLDAESQDCWRHVRAVVSEVRRARQALDRELDRLLKTIEKTEERCARAQTPEEKAACEKTLDDLDDQLEKKVKTRKRMKKVEDQGNAGKALLGLLAIIVGVIIGVYCCPKLGASIAAWGGKTLQENQPRAAEDKAYEDQVADGRQRKVDAAGDATEEDRQALQQDLRDKGFEPVPFEGVPDGVAVQIVRSADEIRVYLVKSRRLVAALTDANTHFLGTDSGLTSLNGLQNLKVVGNIFGERNIVRLRLLAAGPDGTTWKILVSEQSLGAQEFSVTVDR